MKVAVSATGDDLNANIDPRFGRCMTFLIVDLDSKKYKAVKNPAINEGHGAGISAAQFVINQGVDAVLTGNIGPNAHQVFNSSNVKIYVSSGNIKDNLEKMKNGELSAVSSPTNAAHSGMGRGQGRGMGRGGGRGMGRRRN
ncbi:MAG: NifB/NifX family molybdenum-iron cluster-binding protein [Asgard group archaeon]|nr:NifB/NifX family molybdenum-iron cluster-binding protein [Asgard group archaeon]